MFRVVSGRSLAVLTWLVVLAGATGAAAGDQLLRGDAPAWVVGTTDPVATPTPPAQDGVRFLLFDTQFRAGTDHQAIYLRTRAIALSPQALPLLGNVGVAWSPANQDLTIHHVNIIRDGQTIDVLATQSFDTLRREENLEQAMLDGQLTASLQPSGLRTGDILDVAYSIVSRDPVTGPHAEQAVDLNIPVMVDQIRYRASWPRSVPMQLRAANDWTPLDVRREGDRSVVEVRLDAAQPVMVPYDVPGRLRAYRGIELSDYLDWSEIAVALKPLYDRTRQLAPDSPLHAEIERIRALSSDPAVQAAAALRLVQDQVRYVALLMGDGALVPATADETWARRFGDCKAKTALLLALLDGLGIKADAAAVSLSNGDGMDERLPMISAFDHVLVRTEIGGTVYWLDGTRTGDRALGDVTVPPFSWALPLTGPQARLEPLVVAPKSVPDTETTLAIDASAGLYAPAAVTGTAVMRGDAAALLGGQIGLLSSTQRDQGLRQLWLGLLNDPTITEVNSTYDVEANVLTMTMKGSVELDWSNEGLIPPGSTYSPIGTQERSEGPFRTAPYAIAHPSFARQVATLRLPEGGQGFRLAGGQVDRTELGHELRRKVSLEADRVTVEVTTRSLVDEITAAEADKARAEADTRAYDPPRVFAAANYRPSEADRAAWESDAPTTSSGWVDRATALSRAGDSEGAVEAATRATTLSPDSSNAWANLGVYRFWAGDREGAAAALAKATDIDPSERIAMNGNALIALNENRFDDAVIEMSRALRQLPNDDFALQMRATAYMALKQYDRALKDVDTRIAARPDDMSLKLFRIAALDQAGRIEQADAEMDALAIANPSDRIVRVNQAALKLERGQAQAASEILDQVVIAHPENTGSALLLRAKAAIMLGQLDKASGDFDTLRTAKPDDAETLNSLCWTAAEAGVLLDQALKDCDAALAIAPDAAHILDSRARVLLQQGDMTAAASAYDAALAKAPRLAASLYGRGLALTALGRNDDGDADKAAAIAIAPRVAEIFVSYAKPEGPVSP